MMINANYGDISLDEAGKIRRNKYKGKRNYIES